MLEARRRSSSAISHRAAALLVATLLAFTVALGVRSAAAQEFRSEDGPFRVVTVASGLENPWGLAFLPEGPNAGHRAAGALRVVTADGSLSEPVAGVPAVYAVGQGGLLDVALDPRFAENRLVYLSYAEADGEVAGTAVARGRFTETDGGQARLDDVQVIFRQRPKVSGPNHWGSRLVFAPDGTLFVTLGERYQRDRAQRPNEDLGKLVRINADGSVPKDNPFAGESNDPAGNLVDRPSQHAGRGDQPRDRPAVDC